MHEAYAQEEMTAAHTLVYYLAQEKLHKVFPYSLVFIKFDEEGEK